MNSAIHNISIIFKREVASAFTSPVAYVVIIAFLLLSNTFAFGFGALIESGDAALGRSFFIFHPWFYVVLAPAIAMRQWSDEHRLGTIELLLTMPIKPWHAILGKYMATCLVWLLALGLTFPIWWTVNYLGNPDNGVIFAGYVGSYLVCCTCLAITTLVSSLSRSQVVCLIVSVVACLALTIIGFEPIVRMLSKTLPGQWVTLITDLGFFTYFNNITRGVLVVRDIFYFCALIFVCLIATNAVLHSKRA